jgi:hypothetical protein
MCVLWYIIVNSGTCVSIVVKTKYVNFGNMSDICSKLDFTINYILFTTTDTIFIKTHIHLTICDTNLEFPL